MHIFRRDRERGLIGNKYLANLKYTLSSQSASKPISLNTHVCPVKSRGAPPPEGSLPDLHSAGLYDSATDDNTKTYLEEMMKRKEQHTQRKDRFSGVTR